MNLLSFCLILVCELNEKKRLLNICVLLEWNFSDIDFPRVKRDFFFALHTSQKHKHIAQITDGGAILWYNGNFSRDFYGSDFAFLLLSLLLLFIVFKRENIFLLFRLKLIHFHSFSVGFFCSTFKIPFI
jgi:hypothetical protein